MPPPLRTTRTQLTWHILGTGAMACLWAGSLVAAGHGVRMIGRNPPAREAYHELTVATADQVRHYRVCLEAIDDDSPVNRVLVCTKAGDATAALAAQRRRLEADCDVVLLQNGMGFQDAVAALLPGTRVFAAATTEGAWLEAPFCVRHAGRGETVVGRWPGGAGAVELSTLLTGGWLEVRPTADIRAALWRKLVVNCAINPLTALHGVTNGRLLDDPTLAAKFDALCAEIEQVLRGLGHESLAAEAGTEARRVARATAANRCSMLQDLDAGRRTEIAWITGFLCEAARRAGISCPLNEALLAAVHARESR